MSAGRRYGMGWDAFYGRFFLSALRHRFHAARVLFAVPRISLAACRIRRVDRAGLRADSLRFAAPAAQAQGSLVSLDGVAVRGVHSELWGHSRPGHRNAVDTGLPVRRPGEVVYRADFTC